MEKIQIKILNNLLSTVTQLRREERKDITLDNKETTFFYFEVYLLEMIPRHIYNNNVFKNLSPQEIYLGYLKGDKIYMKYKEFFSYQNIGKNFNLLKMVTPNLNKKYWYHEDSLIQNRLIKVLCKMF